jgi:peptide/nickel transport system permease protein
MTTYIARRALQSVIILFGLTIFFFVILNAEPGGPCARYLTASSYNAAAKYHLCVVAKGLDQPLPVQYWRWLSATAHGDLGQDLNGTPVTDIIKLRIPATILLIGLSYLFQELVALPLGLLGALKRYSLYDQVLTLFSYVGLSLPTFWLSLMLILIVSDKLGWLPPGGITTPTSLIPPFATGDYWAYLAAHPGQTIGDFVIHLILPALTLAVIGIGGDSRFMRASMLDVINQDFVRTARAKGLPQSKVVLKHALRNALLPIITNVGLFIPNLVSGAIITETIFGWPGMGQYFIQALGNKDNTTLQSLLLLSALFVLIGNLTADLLYAAADPRIRYD